MEFSSRQLRFAVAVADCRSFTEAAATCHVTQPTLSAAVAQLEATLGERLFLRTTRHVSLTPFGEHLLPYLREAIRAQALLGVQAAAYRNPQRSLLRIGTSPLIRANLLALILEPYQAQHPAVDVVLREMNMADLYRMLDDGMLDVVIGVAGTAQPHWQTTPVYREPLRYLPRGTARVSTRAGDRVRISDIAEETFVMVPDACGLARTTRALFRRHRRTLHEYSGEAMSYQVLEEWAALGVGAAILPQSKVTRHEGRAGQLITDKAGAPVTIAYDAVWRRDAVDRPHLAQFVHHLSIVAPRIAAGVGEGTNGGGRSGGHTT